MNESGRNDTEIITAAQMRALEQAAIARGRVTGASLMEQAGQGAAQAITRHWPDGARRALIMCGAGNNGGDGYVIARHLLGAGWRVDVVASAPPRPAAMMRNRPLPRGKGPVGRSHRWTSCTRAFRGWWLAPRRILWWWWMLF